MIRLLPRLMNVNKYILSIKFLYFCFFSFASICILDASPINKRYSDISARQNNFVIKAEIGQTVNISCYFDGELLGNDQQARRKRRSHDNRHIFKSVDTQNYFTENNFDEANANENGLEDQQTHPGSYEIDWFFLDNQGRMNIISYGSETTSRYKYKTFYRRNREQLTGDSPYSSSALYSQSIRGNENEVKLNQRSSLNQNTYYLSALIESESDEGIYQCINPFKPNHVIQNTTVLIARNHSKQLRPTVPFAYLFLFLLTVRSFF